MMHGVRVRNVLSQDLWHKDWKTKPCCKRLPTSARAGQIDDMDLNFCDLCQLHVNAFQMPELRCFVLAALSTIRAPAIRTSAVVVSAPFEPGFVGRLIYRFACIGYGRGGLRPFRCLQRRVQEASGEGTEELRKSQWTADDSSSHPDVPEHGACEFREEALDEVDIPG
jgi:hypothetical protein